MSIGNKCIGPEKIVQLQFQKDSNAQKVMDGLLVPGSVITTDISAAGVYVGKGNVLRIRVGVATYVAFGSNTISAVSNTTSPAIELDTAGVYLVVATDDYVRASANPPRVELING